MKCWGWVLLMIAGNAFAADWQFLGASDSGAYYADRHSLKWQEAHPIFTISTNVIEKDRTEWHTVIRIDCGGGTFTYLSGARMEGGKASLRFDTPRSTEKILAGTMPDLLRSEYCGAKPTVEKGAEKVPEKIVRWEPAGKSSVANVYFDRASFKQEKDGFIIDTKVVPFNHEEETYGTVVFSCKDKTFIMLKLDRLKEGKLEKVFDKPQPPLPTSKMATLEIVAGKFCGDAKTRPAVSGGDVCTQALTRMHKLETRIQQDADDGGLQCKQVDGYLEEIESIAGLNRQHDCGINGLDAYSQQVRIAGCAK
ncbi:MAG TPA: hypothetical protein VD810_03705 [Methylophilaceae bacterium]|nr:hypothetical protein [Methylophilaceae bacterium]